MHGKTCDVSEYIYKICIICNVVSWMFQYTCTERITYGINIWFQQETGAGDENAAELDLANVGGVFIVLLVGTGIAFFIAILEFLWNVRKVAVDEQVSSYCYSSKLYYFNY